MIISSITVNNIRSYESCHIDFDSGTTLLIGDIGSGKSSILIAIEFALFGFGGQSSDAILTKGKESGSVQLAFESNGHQYEIFRSFKLARGKISQDTKHAWISTDGVRDTTLGVGELKQKVIEILGTDEPSGAGADTSIFRYAVYTPQEDMQAVLSNPVKRQETIRRAFKIDGFATALENSKDIVSDIKRSIKEYSIRFEDLPSWEEKMTLHKNKIDALNRTITSSESEQDSITLQVETYDKLYAKHELDLASKNKLDSEAEVLKSKIDDTQQIIDDLNDDVTQWNDSMKSLQNTVDSSLAVKPDCSMTLRQIDVKITKLRPNADELIRVNASITGINSEISDMRESLPIGSSDIKDIEKLLSEINDQISSAKTERDGIVKRGATVRANISMLEENADSLQSDDHCPLCQQGLDGSHGKEISKTVKTKTKSLKSEMKHIADKQSDLDDKISKMELELSDTAEELQIAKNAESVTDSINIKLKKLESLKAIVPSLLDDKTCMDDLESMRGAVSDYEEQMSLLADAKHDITALESQIKGASETVDAETKKLNSLEKDWNNKLVDVTKFDGLDDDMNDTRSALDEWRTKESKHMSDLAVSRTELKNAHGVVSECEDKISDCNSWRDKHGKFSRCQEWMEKIFMPSLQVMEKQSLEYVRARFNRLYGDFYSMLLDDPTKESSIDADFTPVVTESGHEQSVDNLSGGEKTSIALAYRLTLAKMVREDSGMDGGVLVLDEPTDGFSKSQLEKVRTVLDEAGATQVILVSHDAELESYADRIYRVSKSGGRSRIES